MRMVVRPRQNSERGPLLIISAEKDNTAPPAIANASYRKQERNEGVTETVQMPDRGHGLVVDHGWREVADTSLEFITRFAAPDGSSEAGDVRRDRWASDTSRDHLRRAPRRRSGARLDRPVLRERR
jgi:hypothetical protein